MSNRGHRTEKWAPVFVVSDATERTAGHLRFRFAVAPSRSKGTSFAGAAPDLMRHRQDLATMGNWFGHRRIAKAALGALLACAQPALAQEARPSPSLTGIPDIDFSLPVRQAENPGTPTEGRSLRQAPTPEPSGPESGQPQAAAAPVRSPEAPVARVSPERAGARPSEEARPVPPPASAVPNASAAQIPDDEAKQPDRGTVQPFDISTVAGKAAADASGLPLWPLGLAVLAAVAWIVLRRRRQGRGSDEALAPDEPVPASLDLEPGMEILTEPPAQPASEPVAPPPAPAPEAHPALRVRIPEAAPVRPSPPAAPVLTLYDAFGRPIVAQPAPPKPTPKLPPKPRVKIVRYDAMGLPIRD